MLALVDNGMASLESVAVKVRFLGVVSVKVKTATRCRRS